jgi:collagenase-like PrtC family protease
MKKLCAPTTWNKEFLQALEYAGLASQVYELYGSLQTFIIGSGRPAHALPKVTPKEAKSHIESASRLGIKFNFLLNASCLGNRECHQANYKQILQLLDWLSDTGVETVTVSNPYLAELAKKENHPLKVNVSTIASVDSVQKAKFWKGLGVDRITLDFMQNRNFRLIRGIKEICGELEVLANDQCLYGCPFRSYHYNIVAHASESPPQPLSLYPDVKCALIRLEDPSQIIKARWIRPEDLGKYEQAGVNYFKIIGRGLPRMVILACIQAYAKGKYDGNLLDIVPFSRVLNRPLSEMVHIDNRSLDGFIDFFDSHDCSEGCQSCKHCELFAKNAMRVKEEELEKAIAEVKQRYSSHASMVVNR